MVSVILPTYNESEIILDLINSLLKIIKEPLEVLVIDDNSPDLTWGIVEKSHISNVRVIRRMNERGLATAIDRGIKESKGDIVGWMDADMSMPPSVIPGMLSALRDADIAIGSRYVPGGKDARGFFRALTSKIINWFAGLLLGFDIRDYDSGFIVLKKSVFSKVNFPSHGYGDYFIEFIYKCKKAGFKVKEIPYIFTDRKLGKSKTQASLLGFFKLGSGYIKRIIAIRFSK
ncbi:MAG: polyprenol monophosphomannose synthase [Candidatus Omnitrophica bacterium]|nr:polyprenol monophosphomannose synthase [Candidatus Omnitrophota bacterium]